MNLRFQEKLYSDCVLCKNRNYLQKYNLFARWLRCPNIDKEKVKREAFIFRLMSTQIHPAVMILGYTAGKNSRQEFDSCHWNIFSPSVLITLVVDCFRKNEQANMMCETSFQCESTWVFQCRGSEGLRYTQYSVILYVKTIRKRQKFTFKLSQHTAHFSMTIQKVSHCIWIY